MVMTLNDLGHYHPPTSAWQTSKNIPTPGNSRFKKMTREQFEQWLDYVDSNKDGYISRKELYAALDTLGMHFKTWKSWRAVRKCDRNHNHVIDPGTERKKLIDYAEKRWRIIVTNS